MAKQKKSSALARLVDSIEIKNSDGSTTMVPVSAEDNATANKILASQMRNLIQKSIVKFGDLALMTPKELKELAEAARNVAELSGEVYKSGESIGDGNEKTIEPAVTDILDFSRLKANQTKGEKVEEAPETPPSEAKASGNT